MPVEITEDRLTDVSVPFVDTIRQGTDYREQFHQVLDRLLTHGQYILGEEVEALEKALQDYLQLADVVTVGNGTDGLILCLKALGIGVGDEVITTSLSYLASTSCIALSGAAPVFADVGEDLNLLPAAVEEAITTNTKAILVVHLAGNPADVFALRALADRHGLFLIEDCAQAFGATIGDQYCGSVGDLSAVSFHPLKTLGALGDGGAILCRDHQYGEWLRMARNHGHNGRDKCDFWSYNSRLDALQAGFLSVLLKDYPRFLAHRRAQANAYRNGLEKLEGLVSFPHCHPGAQPSYGMFVVRAQQRNALQHFLNKAGIETKIHYPTPIHQLKAAESLTTTPSSEHRSRRHSLAATERYSGEILSLPMGPHLSHAQLTRVTELLNQFYRQ